MNTGMPCENLERETMMQQQSKKDPKVHSKEHWDPDPLVGIRGSHLGDGIQVMS